MFVLPVPCGVLRPAQEDVYLPVRLVFGLRAVSLHNSDLGRMVLTDAHTWLPPLAGGILHRLLRGPGVLQEPVRTDRQRKLKGLRETPPPKNGKKGSAPPPYPMRAFFSFLGIKCLNFFSRCFSQSGDGHPEGRAGHIVQARPVEELHTGGVAAVLAAMPR